MTDATTPVRPRLARAGAGAGLLLVIVLVVTLIAQPATRGSSIAAALALAAGIFGMTWFVVRARPAPHWAWWTTAAVMSAVLVGGVLVTPASEFHEVWAIAWLLPWVPLGMSFSRAASPGRCAVEGRRGGWLMVAVGLVLALISVGTPVVASLV